MLFQTLLQGKLFLIFLFFGILFGFLYEISRLIENIFKNKVITFIIDLISGLIFTALFIFIVNLFNYGEFRLYLLLAYLVGLFIERKSVGFLFCKVLKFLSNNIKKLYNVCKKSKFIAKIFK